MLKDKFIYLLKLYKDGVKMIEQNIKPRDPRTQFTLENLLRMSFHPKGIRDFLEGVNKELELGPAQSSLNRYIGTFADILKYTPYTAAAGLLVYEFLK